MGETTWETIVFGEEAAEPLLGVTALESVGIEVDPRDRTLRWGVTGFWEGAIVSAEGYQSDGGATGTAFVWPVGPNKIPANERIQE